MRRSLLFAVHMGNTTLLAILLCWAGIAASAKSALARPDLTGVVRDERGIPIPGASVFIYTAAPKEGTATLCPSCYADCRKSAQTDANGRFRITSLDPSLLFRVLAVARNFQPAFVGKIDPAPKPIEVTLKMARAGMGANQQARGRVLGTQGKPVQGAVVSLRGVTRGNGTRYGGNEDMDQVAVSDEHGDFVMTATQEFDSVGVRVEAAGYARGVFSRLPSGGQVTKLFLTEGASITGRLVKDGRPLAGIEMGVSGANREASVYVGDFTVGTDKDGRFLLNNLPPNRDYFLYAKMDSLGALGAITARRVRLGGDGSTLDAGDVHATSGATLAGQIRLTDGEPVPPKTRVLLSRNEAWDSIQVTADAEGRFAFRGVPAETVNLSVGVKGYRYSKSNRSLDLMNGTALVGVVKADKTDLVAELEPGRNQFSRVDYADLRQEPLEGAEPRNRSGDIHVTGSVRDAKTGKPIQAFKVTEGRARFPGRDEIQWMASRTTQGAAGKLDVYLSKSKTAPALMIEAEGYFPKITAPISQSVEMNVVLEPGQGPSGTVIGVDGNAVAGIKVYVVDSRNSLHISRADFRPSEFIGAVLRSTTTDEQGRFRFPPRPDDSAIVVIDHHGFAEVLIEELAANSKVKLKPWATVTGVLMIGTRPSAGEKICLWEAQLPVKRGSRASSAVNLFLQTTTDDSGRFAFERVPPMNAQVYHEPKVKDDPVGAGPMSQTTSFALNPGERKELVLGGQGRPVIGKVTVQGYDKPINWRAEPFTLELVRSAKPAQGYTQAVIDWIKEQAEKIRAAVDESEKNRSAAEMSQKNREMRSKLNEAYANDESRDAYFRESKRYALNFDQKGSFRVEDVPAGKYRLRIDLREKGQEQSMLPGPQIGYIDTEVEIPGMPGERSDEPHDLGVIELHAAPANR